MYRTHNCNELRIEDIGKTVKLSGFIQTIRDLGSVIFIDLRDQYGITQIVLNDEKLLEKARTFTKESTMQAVGIVRERSDKNPKIETGDIEILAKDLILLGRCLKDLPFEINDNYKANKEDLRLKYRYLDLRNKELHDSIIFRADILRQLRQIMNDMGFVEIQTPIFSASSPEGSRDYLIPSRLNIGEFYALPQAPQQYKQLLMISGFDKYFQIAPCFRDEDPRADRAPCEFYQLDFEMSFVEQEDVLNVLEKIFYTIFKNNTNYEVNEKFIRLSYKEAMEKYGSDKPDLRIPTILHDLTNEFENIAPFFKDKYIIAQFVNKAFTRKKYDEFSEIVKSKFEGNNLYWFKAEENILSGGISKFIDEKLKEKVCKKLEINTNNYSVFLIAEDKRNKALDIAGRLRNLVAKEADIIEKNTYKFCFILDFPMYELTEDGKIDFGHNPFSMPQGGIEALNTKNPLDILAYQYDAVCNGYEVASGAIRNHDINIMKKAFEIAGYSNKDVENKFGALYTAFQYGAPPHAGAAPGIDRMIMLLRDTQNIREVIAFPKNSKARDLLMGAPTKVSKEQLEELHIKLDL